MEKEFRDKEQCRAARVSAIQVRDDLLSQVTHRASASLPICQSIMDSLT